MNIYDNETTSKLYPDLNPRAPQEPQTYRLKNSLELRHFFLMKLKLVNGLQKMNWLALITSTVITGGISIAAFASGVGLPVGIALSGTSLLFSLATVITRKSSKTFTVKQEKHDAIKLLAQSKLDSIANSPVMQDGDIHWIS